MKRKQKNRSFKKFSSYQWQTLADFCSDVGKGLLLSLLVNNLNDPAYLIFLMTLTKLGASLLFLYMAVYLAREVRK